MGVKYICALQKYFPIPFLFSKKTDRKYPHLKGANISHQICLGGKCEKICCKNIENPKLDPPPSDDVMGPMTASLDRLGVSCRKMVIFIVLFYARPWFEAPLASVAARSDLSYICQIMRHYRY